MMIDEELMRRFVKAHEKIAVEAERIADALTLQAEIENIRAAWEHEHTATEFEGEEELMEEQET
jgi:hypothetical protein